MSQTNEQIRATLRLDAAILHAMQARPSGTATYVVRNILSGEMGYAGIKTDRVRARLNVMQRWGQVERTPSSCPAQIYWRVKPTTGGVDHG